MDENHHQLNNKGESLWRMNIDYLLSMGSKRIGSFFEGVYYELCRDYNVGCTASTEYVDNALQHTDYSANTKSGGIYTIDIKATKKKRRRDTCFTTNILLEMVGRTGYPGWLHGKADYIGFFLCDTKKEKWWLVTCKRRELLDYVLKSFPNYKVPRKLKYSERPPLHTWLTSGKDTYIWVTVKDLLNNLHYVRHTDCTKQVERCISRYLS